MRIFSVKVSIWFLTWLQLDSEVSSLEGSTSFLPLCGPMGGVVQSLFGFSGGVSFSCHNGVGPNELLPPCTTYRCIMCIISASCSFRRVMSLAFSSTREGPLVDISFARDLVMMRSWCDGNFDCFLGAIFSLYNPGKNKRMGRERYDGTFENLRKWKHKTNTKLV